MSDLHLRKPSDSAYRSLKKSIKHTVDLDSIDAVLLGGDLSDFKNGFQYVLQDLTDDLFPTCPIGVVSGNHDIWGQYWDNKMTSDYVLFKEMPRICKMFPNVTWLEESTIKIGNWLFAGSLAWYDYSSKREGDATVRMMPDDFYVQNKANSSADARYVHFSQSDIALSQELRENLTTRLGTDLKKSGVDNLAVFTHVPVFSGAIQWKDSNWNLGCQYFYNLTLGDSLRKYDKLKLVMSGHTHHGVEETLVNEIGTDFQHLVSYADYGHPEAYLLELEEDGTVKHKRIGLYHKFNNNF